MTKAKFNFIDAIIILVILAVIAAGIYMFLGGGLFTTKTANVSGATTKIQYSVEIKNKTAEYAENIKIGDVVQIGDKEKASAVIENIEILPAKMFAEDKKQGLVTYSEIPNVYDVVLTLSSDGKYTDTAVYADNVLVRVGEKVTVRGKGYSGNGFVMSLDVSE